jgi:hypothetical protein
MFPQVLQLLLGYLTDTIKSYLLNLLNETDVPALFTLRNFSSMELADHLSTERPCDHQKSWNVCLVQQI